MSWLKNWYKNLCVIVGMLAVLTPILYLIFFGGSPGTYATERIELVDENDPLSVYSKPLRLTVGQMMTATKYVQGESPSDNVIYDAYRELLNIDIVCQFSAMVGTAYSQQLSMAVISNNLPDLFFCNQNELNDLIDQGMVEDLTDAYYKYASPGLRLAIEYNYTGDLSRWNNGNPIGLTRTDNMLNMVSKDGRIYAFPYISDIFDYCPLIWIRTDWLAKYAESKNIVYDDISEVLPKDFNEYLDIVRYFSTANLFNGGKSYGVATGFAGSARQAVGNIYGAYPDYFIKKEDGSYEFGSLSDNFMNAMKLFNELYRTGCIDPNSMLDDDLMKQALAAGKIGSLMGEFWSCISYLADSVMNNPECDWLPWAIRDFDGNIIEPMVPTNLNNKCCYAIRKGFANPEVVFIIANHLVDRFFGGDGIWNKRMIEIRTDPKYILASQEVEMYSPVRLDAPNKNMYYAFDIQKALITGDTSEMNIDCKAQYDLIKKYVDDPRGEGAIYYGLYKVFGPTGAYKELTKYTEYDYNADKYVLKVNFKRPGYEGMYTQAMLNYMGIIEDFITNEFVDILVSPNELTKERWDRFTAGVYQRGMNKILESLKGL